MTEIDVPSKHKCLYQDEWSLSKPTFGKDGHLKVIGWNGRNKTVDGAKYYVVVCEICSEDSELFVDGHFKSTKSELSNGRIPCGCSNSPRWSKDQYFTLCSRKASEIGYTFLGFEGKWDGKSTKIKMLCDKHGEWSTSEINTLINRGYGCPSCGREKLGESKTKPDELLIASFFATGAFHPDTKFWRSERTTKQGWKNHWHIYCPICDQISEAYMGNIKRGSLSCLCNTRHRQTEAYINYILDETEVIAIKFGISSNSSARVRTQNLAARYRVENHSIYSFSDVKTCRQAERECKKELECGIVLKRDMKDGYTETTWVYNIDKIIEIYVRNGGIRVE